MKLLIGKFNRYRIRKSHRFYSQKYPKIQKGGKRSYVIRSIVGWLLGFGVFGSVFELYRNYPLNLLHIPIEAIGDVFSVNLLTGFFVGLVWGNIQWALWRDGFQNYKTKIAGKNTT